MINKILEELDRMMDAQEREIEIDTETEHESRVYFETAKLFAYREVEKIIKKCAQEAATSEGTDINSLTQANYNTDRQKSEIRKLAVEVKNVPGSKVSMLVDEEFYFHCDGTKLNKIASWLYETDGSPILGNALIIGEKYGNEGIAFCEMSEEQFDLVFPKLEELGKRFKDAGD